MWTIFTAVLVFILPKIFQEIIDSLQIFSPSWLMSIPLYKIGEESSWVDQNKYI